MEIKQNNGIKLFSKSFDFISKDKTNDTSSFKDVFEKQEQNIKGKYNTKEKKTARREKTYKVAKEANIDVEDNKEYKITKENTNPKEDNLKAKDKKDIKEKSDKATNEVEEITEKEKDYSSVISHVILDINESEVENIEINLQDKIELTEENKENIISIIDDEKATLQVVEDNLIDKNSSLQEDNPIETTNQGSRKNDITSNEELNILELSHKNNMLVEKDRLINTVNTLEESSNVEVNNLDIAADKELDLTSENQGENSFELLKENLEKPLEIEIKKDDINLNEKGFSVETKNLNENIKDTNPQEVENKTIDTKETIKQISEQMKFTISNNKNTMKINLKPETLGELTMEIEVVKNIVVAKVMVDNQKAKEIIENNLFQLKEELKDTALEIKSFEVFVGKGNDFSKNGREGFHFNKKNRNIKIKNAEKKDDNILYYDNSIDSVNNLSTSYRENSLNLLA